MGRHRTRQKATHELTAERDVATGEDEYGSPTYGDTETVLTDERVELDTGGTSFVRESTGERVQRAPTVAGRGELAALLEEGDTVTLTPLADGGVELSDLEVRSIDVEYGRRARVGETTVELESI
jgi:hypothetical protein